MATTVANPSHPYPSRPIMLTQDNYYKSATIGRVPFGHFLRSIKTIKKTSKNPSALRCFAKLLRKTATPPLGSHAIFLSLI
jgi:hypothetical protein